VQVNVYRRRMGAALATALTALAFAGCGGDEESSSDADPPGGTTDIARSAPPPTTADRPTTTVDPNDVPGRVEAGASDEQTIRALVRQFYDSFGRGDATMVCAIISRESQRQLGGANAKLGDVDACVRNLGGVLQTLQASDTLQSTRARTTKVTVRGDRATVALRLNGTATQSQLTKEDGRWVFAGSPVGR